MKVSVEVARESMRRLAGAGAEFTWVESGLHGTWLAFNIKSVYCDRVEDMLTGISDDYAYEINNKKGLATFELFDFTKENTTPVKYLIKVRQWLTKKDNNPIPMRTMEGVVLQETQKAYKVRLNGHLRPSSNCNHCGRRITHPVSLLYGLGSTCGQHFHINPLGSEEELKRNYEQMKKKMEKITWEGWIPKSQIESMVKN